MILSETPQVGIHKPKSSEALYDDDDNTYSTEVLSTLFISWKYLRKRNMHFNVLWKAPYYSSFNYFFLDDLDECNARQPSIENGITSENKCYKKRAISCFL